MPRTKRPPTVADPDAVQQRITDLEQLLVSPGWAFLCAEANKLYGQRVFTEQIEQVVRLGATAEVIAAQVVSHTAARMAAGRLINLPSETLKELQRKLATQQGDAPPVGLGANVEVSRGEAH